MLVNEPLTNLIHHLRALNKSSLCYKNFEFRIACLPASSVFIVRYTGSPFLYPMRDIGAIPSIFSLNSSSFKKGTSTTADGPAQSYESYFLKNQYLKRTIIMSLTGFFSVWRRWSHENIRL